MNIFSYLNLTSVELKKVKVIQKYYADNTDIRSIAGLFRRLISEKYTWIENEVKSGRLEFAKDKKVDKTA